MAFFAPIVCKHMRTRAPVIGILLLLGFGLGGVVAPVVHQLTHPHDVATDSSTEHDDFRSANAAENPIPLLCSVCQGVLALPHASTTPFGTLGPGLYVGEHAPTPLSLSAPERRSARAPPAVLS